MAKDKKIGTKELMCGWCHSAWDLVFKRIRSKTPAAEFANRCPYGGCDPDIWDYVYDEDKKPTPDPRYYHLRPGNVPVTMESRPKATLPPVTKAKPVTKKIKPRRPEPEDDDEWE